MKFQLDFTLYSLLLEKIGVVPDQDFPQSGNLLYDGAVTSWDRSRIRFVLGSRVNFIPAEKSYIKKMQQHWRDLLSPEFSHNSVNDADQEDELRDMASEAPIITLVNNIIEQAVELAASDIHFEPGEKALKVRCRVDGVLVNISELPVTARAAVSSRLKLMAQLDIGEKRLPQDGRIKFAGKSKTIDLRVSTLPGAHGESIVLRILDRSDVLVDLDNLGMPDDVLSDYESVICSPHGMILVTGPTGSGKTTTLYATLDKIYDEKVKIITVEDPVEYEFPGITQVQVKSKIGLTFAAGLRSIVRQDPDIILIGEIRDRETADIAIESSLTGHLVFSTLHTNDAAGAITRLQDIGTESYLISSSVLAILAQRLVRKTCRKCGRSQKLTVREKELLNLNNSEEIEFFRGHGCDHCGHTGYRGRVGVYELLMINDTIRKLIMDGASANTILQKGIDQGMRTLRQDALLKLRQGITTPEEILRISRS